VGAQPSNPFGLCYFGQNPVLFFPGQPWTMFLLPMPST
jgi:hypothetical protein